jgi:putative phosphoribosyl transferase
VLEKIPNLEIGESMLEPYRDRQEGGRLLAKRLLQLQIDFTEALILGLPRGGVVVAYEIALALNAELDVFVVRKLGTPFQPELAMGAIAEGGMLLLNDAVVNYLSISKATIEEIAKKELLELQRREKLYRNSRPSPIIADRTVIVVDDGLATGATMKVAVRALKRKKPAKLLVAAPVGAPNSCIDMQDEVDQVICLKMPDSFGAVGSWYEKFDQTTDDEVTTLLQNAHDHKMKAANLE